MAASQENQLSLRIGYGSQAPTFIFTQDRPLLDLLAQSHQYTDVMMYVINDNQLGWYDNLHQVPIGGYRRDKITTRQGTSLYHLRKLNENETLVCCNALLVEKLTQRR